MRRELIIYLVAIAVLAPSTCHASLDRLLARRQSGESEQENTTAKPQTDSSQQQPPSTTGGTNNGNGSPQGRLYPDLPQNPGPNFLPPFNGHPQHGAMPPFVPFGMPNRLNADQLPGPFGPRMLPPPRPMSPAERLQSQSFTQGLGKRLLSLIGIDVSQKNETNDANNGGQSPTSRSDNHDLHMAALQNSTVLQELNKRVNMIMGGLSKMYNSTVQEQLNLLNERFKKETSNTTNPWQQRVAQQVPMFFQQMAGKVSQAQEQLNQVWRDITQVAQGNVSALEKSNSQPRPFFSAIDQFMNPSGDGSFFGGGQNGGVDGGDFVSQISRSLGMQPGQPGGATNGTADLGARLREFWHVQVQPQMGMVRNQMARVWRDLTTSGALTPDTIARSRMHHMNNNNNNNQSSNDLVDSLLKEADSEAAEFALIAPKSDLSSEGSANQAQPSPQSTPANGMPKLSPQMQNRLMAMQRDLNQLWQGLSSSLQNAVGNVRNTLNPRSQFAPGPMNPNQSPQEVDPAQNEINTKVQDLSKVQREADMLYDTVQQRQTFADRFRGFINNVDLNGLSQLPDRIGDQMNRFGTAIGNFWNTIPERWDNMMAQRRNQEIQAKLMAQMNSRTPTSSPASVAENTIASGN